MANERAKAFVEKHKEIWKFIKFTFTGVSTSVLEMAALLLRSHSLITLVRYFSDCLLIVMSTSSYLFANFLALSGSC